HGHLDLRHPSVRGLVVEPDHGRFVRPLAEPAKGGIDPARGAAGRRGPVAGARVENDAPRRRSSRAKERTECAERRAVNDLLMNRWKRVRRQIALGPLQQGEFKNRRKSRSLRGNEAEVLCVGIPKLTDPKTMKPLAISE